MTLLFGQFPQGAFAAGQFVLHAMVGGVGDPVVPQVPPTPPQVVRPNAPQGRGVDPAMVAYVRREQILRSPPAVDEELAAAIVVLFTLETDSIQ